MTDFNPYHFLDAPLKNRGEVESFETVLCPGVGASAGSKRSWELQQPDPPCGEAQGDPSLQ